MLRIEEILKEKGISNAELARRLGVSRSNVGLTIKNANPRYSTLLEIAEAIGVNVIDLFKTEEQAICGFLKINGKVFEIKNKEDIEKALNEIKDI